MTTVEQHRTLFGATRKFMKEYERRLTALGKIIMEDLKISQEEALALSDGTILPEKSEAAFREFHTWIHEN